MPQVREAFVSESLPQIGSSIDMSARYATTRGPLLRLSYVSRREPGLRDEVLVNLLLSAAVRNYLAGISSELWGSQRFFVHLIEGAASAVEPLYWRICQDDRHDDVTCIHRSTIQNRAFTRPLAWRSVTNEVWSVVGLPVGNADLSFDEACDDLLRGHAVATHR